jgi:uncharacterized integral membrane protein
MLIAIAGYLITGLLVTKFAEWYLNTSITTFMLLGSMFLWPLVVMLLGQSFAAVQRVKMEKEREEREIKRFKEREIDRLWDESDSGVSN